MKPAPGFSRPVLLSLVPNSPPPPPVPEHSLVSSPSPSGHCTIDYEDNEGHVECQTSTDEFGRQRLLLALAMYSNLNLIFYLGCKIVMRLVVIIVNKLVYFSWKSVRLNILRFLVRSRVVAYINIYRVIAN